MHEGGSDSPRTGFPFPNYSGQWGALRLVASALCRPINLLHSSKLGACSQAMVLIAVTAHIFHVKSVYKS